jgi:hypothetical protein
VLLSKGDHCLNLNSLLIVTALKATKLDGTDKTCDEAGAEDNCNYYDSSQGQSRTANCSIIHPHDLFV